MKKIPMILLVIIVACCLDATVVLGADINYTIKAGDNLWSIASRFNTSVDDLKSINSIKSNALKIGDRLLVPDAATRTVNAASGQRTIYWVQAGDSWGSIANRNGMTVAQLKLLNKDCGEQPKVGQKLVIEGSARAYGVVSRSGTGLNNAARLLQRASEYLGTPYSYGGERPGGFDCSGFVRYIFSDFGFTMPHNAAAQSSLGQAISRQELLPGDLVFFNCGGSGISHVGIYCGDDQFIHSSSPRSGGVIYSSLTNSYWGGYYVSASRIFNKTRRT